MAFPLLSVVGGLASNALMSGLNQDQYRSNLRLNQQIAQENALFQDDLTRKLTRDTPVLERQGLVNAGINPAMMKDGTMAAQQGASVSQPSVGNAPYFSESLPSYTSLLQSSLVSSEIDKNKAQADNLLSDKEVKNQQAQQLAVYNEYQRQILVNQIDEVLSRIGVNNEQKSVLRAQAEKTWSEWELLVPKTQMAKDFAQAEYDEIQARIASANASVVESTAHASLMNEQTNTEKSKQAVNYSQASLNAVVARYNSILADFAKHGISLNSFVGSIAGLCSADNADELVNKVFENISSTIAKAGNQMIPQLLKSLIVGIKSLPKAALDALLQGISQ
nr:MAG TPA: hypothetical protein [Microviridae sp.]